MPPGRDVVRDMAPCERETSLVVELWAAYRSRPNNL
jgi:hypothetical protein